MTVRKSHEPAARKAAGPAAGKRQKSLTVVAKALQKLLRPTHEYDAPLPEAKILALYDNGPGARGAFADAGVLSLAAGLGLRDLVVALLDAGHPPDAVGGYDRYDTTLGAAVSSLTRWRERGEEEAFLPFLSLLVDRGARIDLVGAHHQMGAVGWAMNIGDPAVIDWLLPRASQDALRSALVNVLESAARGVPEAQVLADTRRLAAAVHDLDAMTAAGFAPVHMAALCASVAVLDDLAPRLKSLDLPLDRARAYYDPAFVPYQGTVPLVDFRVGMHALDMVQAVLAVGRAHEVRFHQHDDPVRSGRRQAAHVRLTAVAAWLLGRGVHPSEGV